MHDLTNFVTSSVIVLAAAALVK